MDLLSVLKCQKVTHSMLKVKFPTASFIGNLTKNNNSKRLSWPAALCKGGILVTHLQVGIFSERKKFPSLKTDPFFLEQISFLSEFSVLQSKQEVTEYVILPCKKCWIITLSVSGLRETCNFVKAYNLVSCHNKE